MMNDNDKAPEHIRELLGKPVYVRALSDSSRWKGVLAAYHEQPVIVLSGASYAGTGGGMNEGNLVFPAGWHVEERQVPPPPEPCPHCGQTPWNLNLQFG
jgi:hypothetical protein